MNNTTHQSLVLIGMPGSGKSTTGILLAKELGLGFIDTDISIQTQEQKTLQEIIHSSGYLKLRDIEEQVILSTNCNNSVIATGGSAIYSKPAMTHLKKQGLVIFLEVGEETLLQRIHNFDTRGIAMACNQSFRHLLNERTELYQHYTDICLDTSKLSPEESVAVIQNMLANLCQ